MKFADFDSWRPRVFAGLTFSHLTNGPYRCQHVHVLGLPSDRRVPGGGWHMVSVERGWRKGPTPA